MGTPKLIGLLLRIVLANSRNRLVIQDNRDLKTLDEARSALGLLIPSSQHAYFDSVAAWEECVAQFDFSLGGRIHATMTAVASGVPHYIVAPDVRVQELAEVMQIPHTDPFDS